MSDATPPALSELAARCRAVLEASHAEGERRGVPYSYTRPSPTRYPWQWYWDSCFAAIVWRRFDPDRPRAELETLLNAMRPDGFIGHVVFWDQPLSYRRLVYYNVTSRHAEMTGTIQPPLLAWAWKLAVGDPAKEPRIAAHHEWLRSNRDLDGDGLLWLVQPDESGLDSSPKFDPVWGRLKHGGYGFPLLVARNRHLGWDARRIRDRGWPVLCEVMTNVLWCLARISAGEPSITPAIVDRLWDERRGLFLDEAQPGGARPGISTWAALSPLALPDLPDEIGHRLIQRAPARPAALLADQPTALGLRARADLRAKPRPGLEAAATGAGRPGSTPRGCCGSGSAGSATKPRPRCMAERLLAGSCSARGCASTTTRTRARGSGRASSRGRP